MALQETARRLGAPPIAGQAVGVAARIQANGTAYVAVLTSNSVEIGFYRDGLSTFTMLGSMSIDLTSVTSATLQFTVTGGATPMLSFTVTTLVGTNTGPSVTVQVTTPVPLLAAAGGVGRIDDPAR